MTTTMTVLIILPFVMALVVVSVAAYKDGRIIRLEDENRRLREWQRAQDKAPDEGPHRTHATGVTFNPDRPQGSAMYDNTAATLPLDAVAAFYGYTPPEPSPVEHHAMTHHDTSSSDCHTSHDAGCHDFGGGSHDGGGGHF